MFYGRIFLLGLLVALSACDHKKEGSGTAAQTAEKMEGDTRVAAKVDGDEITVEQIKQALSRVGPIPKDREDEASRQLLKGMVDQQILVKRAVDQKLDHNPAVQQALEAARRQILVQAELEQLNPQVSKPTDAEIHEYFIKSPELFAHRRIYKFGQVLVTGTPDTGKINLLLTGTKNLEEFAAKLTKENIPFKTGSGIKSAEELPIALLPKFSTMSKGEVALITANDGLTVLQLQDYKEEPLTEQQSRTVISNFLTEQKRKALLEAEVKKLHDAAKIEYFGAYADLGNAPSAAAPAMGLPASAPAAGKP